MIAGRTQLIAWIKRKLGQGVIHVELTDAQIEDAVEEAEEYWQMWVGTVKSVIVSKGSGTVIPESDIGEDVSSVVDVYMASTGDAIGQYYAWADVEFNPLQEAYSDRNGDYSRVVQYLQYRKDAQRILSSDPDWQWNEATREVVLSPQSVPSGNIGIVYLSTEVDYTGMKSYEWKMFRDYALAKAMRTLATIRMKFGDKPSATGGFSMDGDAMWANAEAMELMIEEKMRNLQEPMGIIIG